MVEICLCWCSQFAKWLLSHRQLLWSSWVSCGICCCKPWLASLIWVAAEWSGQVPLLTGNLGHAIQFYWCCALHLVSGSDGRKRERNRWDRKKSRRIERNTPGRRWQSSISHVSGIQLWSSCICWYRGLRIQVHHTTEFLKQSRAFQSFLTWCPP